MTTINPALVPTIQPGTIFDRFTTDTTLNVRWITALDPVLGEVYNRPIADVALRQLILAKALDAINLRLSFLSEFPFLIVPRVVAGSTKMELPSSWIWDMHTSLPSKWELLRLAKIKRVSGVNGGGSHPNYTGKLRLVFTATTASTTAETALFEADYVIDSTLTYQISEIRAVLEADESNAIDPSEAETLAGYVIFRTLDVNDTTAQAFFDLMAPPGNGSGTDSGTTTSGEYDNPTVYEMEDSTAGGSDDYAFSAISHGTGLLVASAYNRIPALDSDPEVWLNAFNYPFDVDATRTAASPVAVTIPKALFNEFQMTAPAGDNPTGDATGTHYPVWINRIERLNDASTKLKMVFSTYNVGDTPSTEPVEFASLTLESDWTSGRVVAIEPMNDLFQKGTPDWQQHFGRGHVVLSSKWTGTNTEISDFFAAFAGVIDAPPNVLFNMSATRISSFGLSRVPKWTPTIGQAGALLGSTARRDVPINPSTDNRYVTEQDTGLGDQIDFSTCTALPEEKREHPSIARYGYTGGLVHRMVFLTIDAANDDYDYDEDIKPRLECLFGGPIQPGYAWFDGTRMKWAVPTETGETVWVG